MATAERDAGTEGSGTGRASRGPSAADLAVASGGAAASGAGEGAAAVALSAAGVAKVVSVAVRSVARFARARKSVVVPMLVGMLRTEFPERSDDELRALAEREFAREAEFISRMAERLRRDIPDALRASSPLARKRRLDMVLERERRVVDARERAMAERAVGAAQAVRLRSESPDGAVWTLGEAVQHTPECVALAGMTLPHEVLRTVHPPLHPGCRCYLLPIEEALRRGVIASGDVPSEEVARRRVETILRRHAHGKREAPPLPIPEIPSAPVPRRVAEPALAESGSAATGVVLPWMAESHSTVGALHARGGGALDAGHVHGRGGGALRVWDESWVIRNRVGEFAEWVKRIPVGGVGLLGHGGARVRRDGDATLSVVNDRGEVVASGLRRIEDVAAAAERVRMPEAPKEVPRRGASFEVDPEVVAPSIAGPLRAGGMLALEGGVQAEPFSKKVGLTNWNPGPVMVDGEQVSFSGMTTTDVTWRADVSVDGKPADVMVTGTFVTNGANWNASERNPMRLVDGSLRAYAVMHDGANPGDRFAPGVEVRAETSEEKEASRREVSGVLQVRLARDGFFYAGQATVRRTGGEWSGPVFQTPDGSLAFQVKVSDSMGRTFVGGAEWVAMPPGVSRELRDSVWKRSGDDPLEAVRGADPSEVASIALLAPGRMRLLGGGKPMSAKDSNGREVELLRFYDRDTADEKRMVFAKDSGGVFRAEAFGFPSGAGDVTAEASAETVAARDARREEESADAANGTRLGGVAKQWVAGDVSDAEFVAALEGQSFSSVNVALGYIGLAPTAKRNDRSEVETNAKGEATFRFSRGRGYSTVALTVAQFDPQSLKIGAPRWNGVVTKPKVKRGEKDAPPKRLGRMPKTWAEMRSETMGRASELAVRFGATSIVREVQSRSISYGGTMSWSDGVLTLHSESKQALERYFAAKAKGEDPDAKTLRGAFNGMRVLQHEVNHGVVAPGPRRYEHDDGTRALEEATVEESAHVLSAEWMRSLGMDDLLAWADENQESWEVQGTYRRYRENLKTLLQTMEVPRERWEETILRWKFGASSGNRFDMVGREFHETGLLPSSRDAAERIAKQPDIADVHTKIAIQNADREARGIMLRDTRKTTEGGKESPGWEPMLPMAHVKGVVDFDGTYRNRLGGPIGELPVGAIISFRDASGSPHAGEVTRYIGQGNFEVVESGKPPLTRHVKEADIVSRLDSDWRLVESMRRGDQVVLTPPGTRRSTRATFVGMTEDGKMRYREPSGALGSARPWVVASALTMESRFSWMPGIHRGSLVWVGGESGPMSRLGGVVVAKGGNERLTMQAPSGGQIEHVQMGTTVEPIDPPEGWDPVSVGDPVLVDGKDGVVSSVIPVNDPKGAFVAIRVRFPDGSERDASWNDAGVTVKRLWGESELDRLGAGEPGGAKVFVRNGRVFMFIGVDADGKVIGTPSEYADTQYVSAPKFSFDKRTIDHWAYLADPNSPVKIEDMAA